MKKLLDKVKMHKNFKDHYKEIEDACNYVNTLITTHKIYNIDFSYGICDVLFYVMVDYKVVIASILYPFVKAETITAQDLQDKYSQDIIDLINTLLKLESLKINTKQSQSQSIKNMFIALAKDIRVIILKLAIEQHKTVILDKYNKSEQDSIMFSVKEVYAPLAAMIGIGYIKNSLENIIFKYYNPTEYNKLNLQLHKYVDQRNNQINISIKRIKKEILPIVGQVYGRQKQISSIYKKLLVKHELSKVYDIMAVRVIVNTIEECYTVLGKIHAIYQPLNRFKDYIAQPKANGYQSLHTSVVVENGDVLEIQIRTIDMHNYAEYGFAAHWAYKEKRKVKESDKKINYIRSVMELYKQKTPEEMLDVLKIDVYSGNIFCQTPQGKVVQFPEGATPIDFAYAIHSKVGDTCVGAKVNDKMVPITTQLQNGDVVEILTNSKSNGPSRDWLKIVKTSTARNRINAFFKREMKDENIKRGKSILEAQAKTKNLNLSKLFKEEYLSEVFDKYSLSSVEDLYASVGYGGLTANQILTRLTKAYNDKNNETPATNEELINALNTPSNIKSVNPQSTVSVYGYANLMTKFAKCCNPLPGDDIIGYVSRGKGVTVHRINCQALNSQESERFIECSWNEGVGNSFVGTITVMAINSPNTIASISKKFSDLKINILSLKNLILNQEQIQLHISVNVEKKQELEELILKLKQLSSVIDAYRAK